MSARCNCALQYLGAVSPPHRRAVLVEYTQQGWRAVFLQVLKMAAEHKDAQTKTHRFVSGIPGKK